MICDPRPARGRSEAGGQRAALTLGGAEVSVVYFRAGYTPDDYLSAKGGTRLLLERCTRSSACRWRSISRGARRLVAAPGELERFCRPPTARSCARSCGRGRSPAPPSPPTTRRRRSTRRRCTCAARSRRPTACDEAAARGRRAQLLRPGARRRPQVACASSAPPSPMQRIFPRAGRCWSAAAAPPPAPRSPSSALLDLRARAVGPVPTRPPATSHQAPRRQRGRRRRGVCGARARWRRSANYFCPHYTRSGRRANREQHLDPRCTLPRWRARRLRHLQPPQSP